MKVLLYYEAQLAKSESCFISAWDYLGFIDIAEDFCEEAIYWLFLRMIHFQPSGKHIITQRNALNQRTQSWNAKRWGSNQGQPEDLLSFYIQSEGEQLSEKCILCSWWRISDQQKKKKRKSSLRCSVSFRDNAANLHEPVLTWKNMVPAGLDYHIVKWYRWICWLISKVNSKS